MFDEIMETYLTNKERIICMHCGRRHFPEEDTFFSFYGNVMIGLTGGIIGNNFNDDETLKKISFLCKNDECLYVFNRYNKGENDV